MGPRVEITPGAYVLGAAALLCLPFPFLMGVLLAAVVHEGCHYAAVLLTGGQVYGLQLDLGGARMEVSPLSPGREVLCALAGPAGSLSMLLLSTVFPEAALCGLVQGVFNLLPIWPLDGGRVLRQLLPEAVCAGVEVFSLVILAGAGIWLSARLAWGLLPILILSCLWLPRKLACKESNFAVQ